MSALRAVRIGDHAEHGSLSEGRDGAGDESTRCDVAGDGEKDHLVAGGGDSGISDRHMRRWRERYVEQGYNGLLDRRRGKPSRRRVPVVTVEKVFALYRDKYFDLNVQHFHEKLQAEHGIKLSYTWSSRRCRERPGGARTQARGASQAAECGRCRGCCCISTAAATRVSGRTLVRPDRDSGRRHERDLLRSWWRRNRR